MKKNFQEHYRIFALKGGRKHLKELARKGKVYNRYKLSSPKTIGSTKVLPAPQFISIYDANKSSKTHYVETLDFILMLKKNIAHRDCIIDFSETEHITVAAMLIIFSEVQTHLNIIEHNYSIAWSKKSRAVNMMLRRAGFKKLLASGDSIHNFSTMDSLPIVNGVGNRHYEDVVDFIINRYFGKSINPETEYLISDAVSESINNVGRHAYPDEPQRTNLGG